MSERFLNNSEATVLSGVAKLTGSAFAIDIAVSYLRVSGWKSLQPLLERFSAGDVRVLFTDQFELTHPDALELAIRSDVAVRRYVGSDVYHPKVYIARDEHGSVQSALVGSANLSGSGLTTGVEGAVLLGGGAVLAPIGQWFDGLWDAAEEVGSAFVRQYRPGWRAAARARIRMRRFRRRTAEPAKPVAGVPEDVDVLDDLCGRIRLPITILSIDQAGNNVRNLNRLLSVVHDFPKVSAKARSELHLLGLVDGGELTAIGRRARQCRTTRALARAWCRWLKEQKRRDLATINPKIANFKRCASLFWKLRPDVIAFFFDHLHNRDDRDVLKAIELLCNGDEAGRELKIEDFRSLADVLAEPRGLASPASRSD